MTKLKPKACACLQPVAFEVAVAAAADRTHGTLVHGLRRYASLRAWGVLLAQYSAVVVEKEPFKARISPQTGCGWPQPPRHTLCTVRLSPEIVNRAAWSGTSPSAHPTG